MTEPFRPWTWKIPEGGAGGKRGLIRQDGYARASGQAEYTKDINFPGMLYAKILTSPFAHAKIVSMDLARPKFPRREGHSHLTTIRKSPKTTRAVVEPAARTYSILTLPVTGDFYQHPMGAAVVADSEEICDRALKLINIQWEERPFILDMEESLKSNAPKIMPESETTGSKRKRAKYSPS